MKKLLLHIIFCITAITIFLSCNKEEPSYDGNYIMNFVTYEGNKDGVENFSFQAGEESPLIKLHTSSSLNLKWEKGRRTLIDYNISKKISSTEKEIKINQIVSLFFDSVRISTYENILASPKAPIQLKSIWRTGNFINLDCMVPYTLKARQFLLVMDEKTQHNEMVEVYLIQNIMNAETFFWRKAYASFFIGNIWNTPTCKTLRIHLIDEAYPAKFYDFKRI